VVSRIKIIFLSEERSSRATTSPSPPFGTRIIFFVDDGSKSTAAQLALPVPQVTCFRLSSAAQRASTFVPRAPIEPTSLLR